MAYKKKFRIKFHPQANKKLVRYMRALKKEKGTWEIIREAARRLGVFHRYIRENLETGKEPPDTTPEGRATRLRMFMKEYKPKPKKERAPDLRPEWLKRTVKEIRVLVRHTNNAVLRRNNTWDPPGEPR